MPNLQKRLFSIKKVFKKGIRQCHGILEQHDDYGARYEGVDSLS